MQRLAQNSLADLTTKKPLSKAGGRVVLLRRVLSLRTTAQYVTLIIFVIRLRISNGEYFLAEKLKKDESD